MRIESVMKLNKDESNHFKLLKETEELNEFELEAELNLIIQNKPIIDIILSNEKENIINSKSNVIVDYQH